MKIVTAVVNNPTFIEIQYYTLKSMSKVIMNLLFLMMPKNFLILQMEMIQQ